MRSIENSRALMFERRCHLYVFSLSVVTLTSLFCSSSILIAGKSFRVLQLLYFQLHHLPVAQYLPAPSDFERAPQAVSSLLDCHFDLPILSCLSSFWVYYLHLIVIFGYLFRTVNLYCCICWVVILSELYCLCLVAILSKLYCLCLVAILSKLYCLFMIVISSSCLRCLPPLHLIGILICLF